MTKYQSRYVIEGHRDKLKNFMVHSMATRKLQSVGMLLAIAVTFRIDIWTADLRQAYLQALEPIC